MFISKQPKEKIEEYKRLLNLVGSLSNLFSNSSIPYLHYRIAENVFCKAFEADNLSRTDCSIDARKCTLGLGLKTFLENNGSTFQKIAEFNKSRDLYKSLENKPKELIEKIAELRNKRIETTKGMHDVSTMIYHCVSRLEGRFYIFEEPMNLIQIRDLKLGKPARNSVAFSDGLNEYNFNISKSTLLKKFITRDPLVIKVKIVDDPFDVLEKLFSEEKPLLKSDKTQNISSVYLPLYSLKGRKHVPEKSGLNQWNAEGRERDDREVYIPVPIWIHKLFKDFFPGIKRPFNLHLPNKKILKASMCQNAKKGTELGKAIMSNPNDALGTWLLDDVIKVSSKKLVTYKMLEEIGIDSVEVTKIDESNYTIDFKEIGSYEEFAERFGIDLSKS